MPLIIPFFFLLIILHFLPSTAQPPFKAKKQEFELFTKSCPSQSCGDNEPEIRYPLRLDSSPRRCGNTNLTLSCSNNRTIFPNIPSTLITHIDYSLGHLIINLNNPYWSTCLLQNTSLFSIDRIDFYINTLQFNYVNCSQKINIWTDYTISRIAGPVSCFSGPAYFVYAVDVYAYMDAVPDYCVMVLGLMGMPLDPQVDWIANFSAALDLFVQKREMTVTWGMYMRIGYECVGCEVSGGTCGFSQAKNQSFCYIKPRSYGKLIIGICVGGASVITLIIAIILIYAHKKSSMEEELRLKIENFISTYQTGKPTRYSNSEIKKITARFKNKLGQGGFGSVYKGALPNGIPVAVKVLEIEKTKGEEFINEVATMGRIHHVNVVRLLGFSSEGTMRALIYEFMPNESLEKLIFFKESDRIHQRLSMEKLQQIAIGIAQGIEYLHQGCDQRILHFDIKPHNILLDHSFVPKISDFGLAKLCSRDQSMITMTAARGTMGYIAPEIYSRNFGNVSYKSDVYSFGMLLMEMVSGRRNVDPSIEDQSAVYFPEWIYERLTRGEDMELVLERIGDEEKIAKKLIIVALWCIQWSPKDRPAMPIVVQMLLGEIAGLEIPPKPFVSSSLENVMPIIDV